MKLKVLPPTLRKNNHYLILDVKSEVQLTKEEMLPRIETACIRFWGEFYSSNFNLWVMKHYLIDESVVNEEVFFNYKTIIRCQHGYEEDVRAALATLSSFNKKKIAINTIGISGTVKSGISKFIQNE